MELAGYDTQENEDGTQMLKLLYQSLRALLNTRLDNRLVRAVFEMRTLVIQGEYPEMFECVLCNKTEGLKRLVLLKNSVLYTFQYVISAPLERLYTFTLTQETLRDFQKIVKKLCRRYQDREFKSLEVLEEMSSLQGRNLNV